MPEHTGGGRDLASESDKAMHTRFIGKQPVLDATEHLFGYELLFRAGYVNAFHGDSEHATCDVIDQYLRLPPEKDNEVSFINCTRSALTTGIVTLLPPKGVVLEILEDIEPDLELLKCCRELKKRGYRFALDDFSPHVSKLAFLELADFIKVDFIASPAPTRRVIYEMAAPVGATVIAEKVETLEDFQIAKAEGCHLFQGYFFSRPVVIETNATPQSHATCLKALSALLQTPLNLFELSLL